MSFVQALRTRYKPEWNQSKSAVGRKIGNKKTNLKTYNNLKSHAKCDKNSSTPSPAN